MKLVINNCYGGFDLSTDAKELYLRKKGLEYTKEPPKQAHHETAFYVNGRRFWRPDRADPILVEVVEELGDAASDWCAQLKVVELPAGTYYRIQEHDGLEWVETREEVEWEVAT